MKNSKQKMLFSLIMVCLVFNSILITEIFAATTVVIYEPQLGDDFDHLLNHDNIVFRFSIYGPYISYKTYIDGQLDHSLHYVGVDIHYDVNNFIVKYGRGLHTFTVSVSVSGGFTPFGANHQGVTVNSFVMDSVSFTVNPVLCHFVGFGYNEDPSLEYWQSNVLPLKFCSKNQDMRNISPDIVIRHSGGMMMMWMIKSENLMHTKHLMIL